MLLSLVQTLVCVLLIQGGIYALHLTGNIGSSAPANDQNSQNSDVSSMINVLTAASQQHNTQYTGGGNSEDVLKKQHILTPDFLQLERERLMMLGLAKQKAATSPGHRGRPFIAGRIQMTPTAEEEQVDSDYSAMLMQQPQSSLFGSKITHPTRVDEFETIKSYNDGYSGGGLQTPPRRRPLKYEYGREVTPDEMDLDAYMELDPVPEPEPEIDVDELLPDLDGYQYLDELMAEQQRSKPNRESERLSYGQGHSDGVRFPNNFQTFEELEALPPSALEELFELDQKEEALKKHQYQQQQHIAAAAQQRNPGSIRFQQKWQRKRAQQQQQQTRQQQQPKPLQRNIFGDHPKQHHYNQQDSKLSIANSEATATKHIGKWLLSSPASAASQAAMQSSSSLLRSGVGSAESTNGLKNQARQSSSSSSLPSSSTITDDAAAAAAAGSSSASAAGAASAAAAKSDSSTSPENTTKLSKQQQLEKKQLLHPNRKRSGGMSTTGDGVYAGMKSPFSHSMASQLMLRSARGQRQYDVPQIECPTAMDGMERFACPTPDMNGRFRCIDDHVLCDGFIDCPEGEDENRNSCMFYKTTKAHLDVLADALLRWARG